MGTPLKPFPDAVESWVRRAIWLRRLDAVAAWLLVWAATAWLLPGAEGVIQAALAALLVVIGTVVPGLRVRWRPVSGAVALVVSHRLRPGDRAWSVGPDEVELVLVTGRRGFALVIARLAGGPVEGVTVRRTQVFLVLADAVKSY